MFAVSIPVSPEDAVWDEGKDSWPVAHSRRTARRQCSLHSPCTRTRGHSFHLPAENCRETQRHKELWGTVLMWCSYILLTVSSYGGENLKLNCTYGKLWDASCSARLWIISACILLMPSHHIAHQPCSISIWNRSELAVHMCTECNFLVLINTQWQLWILWYWAIKAHLWK